MKKRFVLAILFVLAAISCTPAYSETIAGLSAFRGAAGGALLGQAIGRDTESTLIGTAVGGVLGYMVGNEIDKQYYTPVRTMRIVEPYRRRSDDGECRTAEILATIGGRAERTYGAVCRENGEWVLRGDSPFDTRRTVIINRTVTHSHIPFHFAKHRSKHRKFSRQYRPHHRGHKRGYPGMRSGISIRFR
ncbi:MAG: glycine zipper 2TM domain-containing protein [Desulfobulbaceae bacterium]|nr:glycine zipper 2TM domain-containing protein [Desulfobulbaceae bacterium]MCK5404152.1 glycine zipper 2TM domain-containing protein [Desulfobulbaceae bacterium]